MSQPASEVAPAWHALSVDAVLSELSSARKGLSKAEVERRLARDGGNELQTAARVSPWKILLEQFKNVLIVILLLATVASAFLGHGVETIAIAIIVMFAVVLGFIQEYRAERAIEALREMAAPTVIVIREGREVEVAARRGPGPAAMTVELATLEREAGHRSRRGVVGGEEHPGPGVLGHLGQVVFQRDRRALAHGGGGIFSVGFRNKKMAS